jgi:hypothetical protein
MSAYTQLLCGVIIGLLGTASGAYSSYRGATTASQRRGVLAAGLALLLLFTVLLAYAS